MKGYNTNVEYEKPVVKMMLTKVHKVLDDTFEK